jgi:tetratricopeptide (TPR) repeat protein
MLAIMLVAALVLRLRRTAPGVPAAAAYYLVVLAPVSGLVHSGYQLTHDRYSYLPCLSWAVLGGAGVGWLMVLAQTRLVRPSLVRVAAGGLAVAAAGLMMLTWQQVQVWKDDDSLWRYSLETEPNCTICRSNLGVLLYNGGYYPLARDYFQRAIELRPDRNKTEANLAFTLTNLGELEAALEHFRKLARDKPNDADAVHNVGVVLLGLRRYDEALAQFQAADRLRPDHPVLLANIGFTYASRDRLGEAIPYFERSVQIKPDGAPARFGLALAYALTGREQEAKAHWEKLQALDPRLASYLGPIFLEHW